MIACHEWPMRTSPALFPRTRRPDHTTAARRALGGGLPTRVCYHLKHSTGPFHARMTKVLVLDGCQRSSLAATRSLGRRGLTVFTADCRNNTLAGASRHSRQNLVYPAPRTRAGEFVDWGVSMCGLLGLQSVLPMTDLTTMLLVPASAR